MSEHMYGEIWIGGTVPASLVDELCEAIRDSGVGPEWGVSAFDPYTAADLLEARIDVDGQLMLRLCDDQASGGQFCDLEAFLRANEIAYDRRSDGKYEFDPLFESYRPGFELVEQLTDHSGNPTIRTEPLYTVDMKLGNALVSMHDQDWPTALAELKSARDLLKEHLPPAMPKLAEFKIAEGSS